MRKLLLRANRIIRSARPICRDCTSCTVFHQADLLEISIPCDGCTYDQIGSCIMCDYGRGNGIESIQELSDQIDDILASYKNQYDMLILCTNGSFFSNRNIRVSQRHLLLSKAQNSNASTVLFESHADTINADVLGEIRKFIPQKAVGLEIGLESYDQIVREQCWLKRIDMYNMSRILEMRDDFDIFVHFNVLLGAPFLDKRQQLNDAIHTIKWGLETKAKIVVFPVNVKPFTLLDYMRKKGLYVPISHWLLIELLKQVSDIGLQDITLAWYGNRVIQYSDSNLSPMFPQCCNLCKPLLMQFYEDYNATEQNITRIALLKNIIQQGETICSCYSECLNSVYSLPVKEVDLADIKKQQKMLMSHLATDGIL